MADASERTFFSEIRGIACKNNQIAVKVRNGSGTSEITCR